MLQIVTVCFHTMSKLVSAFIAAELTATRPLDLFNFYKFYFNSVKYNKLCNV